MIRYLTILVLFVFIAALLLIGGWCTLNSVFTGGGDIKITNHTPYPITDVKIEIDWNEKVKATPVKEISPGTMELVELPKSGDSVLYLSYIINGREFRSECGFYESTTVRVHLKIEVTSEGEPAKCESRRD